ncbi:MAG: hypothetical protein BAJALOKI1v1_1820001 [Promethearchaeota archaeon]|nr:MAG: hypothetical protein BAJALOKI1v1_1820001 [Candidatus Lokiarchaeota archaeon]
MEKDIILFIAKWDEVRGVEIVEHYPNLIIAYDLEVLATKMFLFFEQFYASNGIKNHERILFQLPIKEADKFARVLFDIFPSKEREEGVPYIISILLPDYFPKDKLKEFDEELILLNHRFKKEKTLELNEYFTKITDKYYKKQAIQDSEIVLESTYTLKQAIIDFQKGIRLFSTKAYKIAYFVLRKSYLKFKKEQNLKLVLESTYFLSTLLSKLKKYRIARNYYKELEQLATQLSHQKYYEKALFMDAFCAYKLKEYEQALSSYEKLASHPTTYIDKFDFCYFYGKISQLMGDHMKAISLFDNAISIMRLEDLNDKSKPKLAKAYFELANTRFLLTTKNLIKKPNQITYKEELAQVISLYDTANTILSQFNDFENLIISNQIIGNIYENLKEYEKAIIYYRKAMKFTEENNDVLSRMRLFDQIIINLMYLGKQRELIKEIDEMLFKIKAYAFMDLSTIAKYHGKLGKVYSDLGHYKEALSEFLIALNIYKRFQEPREDGLQLLKNIINIYSNTNQSTFLEYYEERYDTYQEQLDTFLREHAKQNILKLVKDFWIFTIEGEEIFSHAPESKSDPQLLSGFLTALRNFSFEMAAEQLSAIKLGLDQYIIHGQESIPYIIVGRASVYDSEISIRNSLKSIFDLFEKEYGQKIIGEEFTENDFTGFIGILKSL